MADKYCSDRKLHDLLAKHGTEDICDGVTNVVESSVMILGSAREAVERTEMDANSPGGEMWRNIRSNGWMETLLCGDSTLGCGQCKDLEAGFSLPESRVKV